MWTGLRVSTVLVLLVFSFLSASAQSATATLNGLISDESGARVPATKITVTNTSTGVTHNGVSNVEGPFAITFLDDDAALRQLAERFYHAMEGPDGQDEVEYLSLWSSRSLDPESKPNKGSIFEKKRVESLAILGVSVSVGTKLFIDSYLASGLTETVSGPTGKVHVRVHMSAVLKPGAKSRGGGYFNNEALLTLRCIKEDGVWKVMEHVLTAHDTAEEFADELVRADTNETRAALLAKRPELVSLDLLGFLLMRADPIQQYDFEKWLDIARLRVQIGTRLGEKSRVADILNEMAVGFGSRGDQAQSLEYFLKSVEISDQLGPEEKARSNYVLANIGGVYAAQGNYSQALEWYQRGLNPTSPQVFVLNNIANTYKNLGDYPKALEYWNESLKKAEALTPNRGRDRAVASCLAGIGDVYVAQGNYSQAQQEYEKALGISETGHVSARSLIPFLLNSLAKLSLLQGNSARAVELVEKAMAMSRPQTDTPGADPGLLVTAGRAYLAGGLTDRARKVLDKVIASAEYRRSHAAGGVQGGQLYFEQLVGSYHEMIKLLVTEKSSADAFAYAERSKARALLDILQSGRVEITNSLTAEEKKHDLELRRKASTLNQYLETARREPQQDSKRIAALETSFEKARLEYEAFQTSLYARHPELSVTRGEMKPITLSETAELMPSPSTALLEYVVTDERAYLFEITNPVHSQPILKVHSIEIKQKDLEERVKRYRNQLATRDPDFLKQSRELFALLLGPVQEELRGKSTLVIVPDGVLWDLPFQSLQNAAQRYVIEEHTVFYAPSLTALREVSKTASNRVRKPTPGFELLALGNPFIGKKVEARKKIGLMDESLDPLPEAEKQVIALAKLYGTARSKVYTGVAATEDRAKTDAPGFRVIQFATHGILNSRSPMYSHLVLSQSVKNEDEDGLLEAWEITKLDLRADLVVLAACETARGRVGAGEGMIGMSWAFFVAGSPTTVASQWKVESASTTQLMLEFHRNLRQPVRMSKAKALQQAAIRLMKNPQYKHPFYWAPFVLIGDGN